ncbi:MAG: folate family ECF transporter S component [Acholeplasma sp.]|nr:folate family ECF transporter S component [Acholeplasma sp.]
MRREVKYLALAGILTALSIGLDLIVKNLIPMVDFGLPYYAIPLIIGGIVLGPVYGGIMGFMSDYIGFMLLPKGSYAILFGLSAVLWGLVPGIFIKRNSNIIVIAIALLVTHMFATLSNTVALWLMVSEKTAVSSLALRLPMLPLNVAVLSVVIYMLNSRLQPVYEDFMMTK